MKRSVIGIVAHVDSGKTTLSEAMLYICGETRKIGRVDDGNAFLDNFEVERRRGITVFSKQAVLHYGDTEFILLDTPGHIDFSSETERTFSVLDCAVMVISGIDGVQSHTETLWRLLDSYKIPVFIFVNKTDITPKSQDELMSDIHSRLGSRCIFFGKDRPSDELFEEISLCDENIMNEYLENNSVSSDSIRKAVSERKIFPVMFGSALKLDGVSEFLDILSEYIPERTYGSTFGAKVYKITEDNGVRLTHMKITGGSLAVHTPVGEEKITALRLYSGEKYTSVASAEAGMAVAAEGLSHTYAGQGLGSETDEAAPLIEPVLTYCAEITDNTNIHTALDIFRRLEEEDPQLHVIWNEQQQEIHVRIMGEIQLEILTGILSERFGLHVRFTHGSICYKETIGNTVEGMGHFEPLRHYAEVHLKLEPLPCGSGIVYYTNCREDYLSGNFQNLIISQLKEKVHIGALTGSPITDIKITLIGGKSHVKHTEGGDFRQAAYRALRQGLRSADKVLLEPWYSFRIELPSENLGRALSDIQQMSGKFSPPDTINGTSIIEGTAPVSEMQGYQKELIAYTKGKGRISCVLKGYLPCHNPDEVVSQIGYDCDSDIANTADSVFCTHGSGYVVPWNEAPEKMHLGSCLNPPKQEDFTVTSERLDSFKSRLYDDKELMEIFERTYGKIKRDDRTKMRRDKLTEYKKPSSKPIIPMGEEYLLVDGYNIIFSWEDLKKLAEDNLDAARSALINRLCSYQGFKGCHLILVFDAYRVKGEHREIEQHHNITVVYTKEAETADTYIEKTAHDLSKDHRVRVATSDNQEQIIILGNGALRVSASEFELEVEAIEKAISSFLDKPQKRFTGIDIK